MQERTNLNEIEGQDYAVAKLFDFIKNYQKQQKKAALLYGPSGTGKTAIVYAFASKFGYEVVEMNASDFRNQRKIDDIIGEAIKQEVLFSKGKIILVDEVEMISGSADRGCLSSLIKLLTLSKFPVFLVTNDIWNHKLDKIRLKTEMIKFSSLNYETITKILSKICKKENIIINNAALNEIAINAKGDARAAINDLKSLSGGKTDKKITIQDINSLGKREKQMSIFDALKIIFKEQAPCDIFDNVPLELDECFLWLDENIPSEYYGKDLENAYNALSKADIFKKRIMKRQHWRFLIYISALMSAGVSFAKRRSNADFVSYKKPTRILKIWLAKQKNIQKKTIAEKLAKATHCSIKRAMKEMSLWQVACRNRDFVENFSRELKLGEEEIAYLRQ